MNNTIPLSFRDRNEDYLVVPKLEQFCKYNNLRTSLDKVELIDSIIDFANKNEDNSIKFKEWLDRTLKEGVKKILVTKVKNLKKFKNKKKEEWEELIRKGFKIEESKYIIDAKHSCAIKLFNYKLTEDNEVIKKVSLNFTVLLKEKKNKEESLRTIVYPIFIDLYLDKGYLVGRSKPKSSLYRFKRYKNNEEIKDDIEDKTVKLEKLIQETFEIIYRTLDIEKESVQSSMHRFKSIIHFIIDECTKTPSEIITKLQNEDSFIHDFITEFFKRQSIDILSNENYMDAIEDIKIFMEKYISINSLDKEIFTNDRYAYPTQIAVTDSDFSSLEESSLDDNPLQCTPIFFDNKKLIHKQKKCDGASFIFKSVLENKKISVILGVKKGYIYIDFRKYVLEEEIENVLSRIIRDN